MMLVLQMRSIGGGQGPLGDEDPRNGLSVVGSKDDPHVDPDRHRFAGKLAGLKSRTLNSSKRRLIEQVAMLAKNLNVGRSPVRTNHHRHHSHALHIFMKYPVWVTRQRGPEQPGSGHLGASIIDSVFIRCLVNLNWRRNRLLRPKCESDQRQKRTYEFSLLQPILLSTCRCACALSLFADRESSVNESGCLEESSQAFPTAAKAQNLTGVP